MLHKAFTMPMLYLTILLRNHFSYCSTLVNYHYYIIILLTRLGILRTCTNCFIVSLISDVQSCSAVLSCGSYACQLNYAFTVADTQPCVTRSMKQRSNIFQVLRLTNMTDRSFVLHTL